MFAEYGASDELSLFPLTTPLTAETDVGGGGIPDRLLLTSLAEGGAEV